MRPDAIETLLLLGGCAVLVVLLVLLEGAHHSYRQFRRACLWEEHAGGHHRLRRRMRGLTRREGLCATTERRLHGRGWVWLVTDSHHEAIGIAWTRRGARRRMNGYLAKGADPTYLICNDREDRS